MSQGFTSGSSGGGSGETNTASNVGNAGVGFYDAKVGVDLQFRNLTSTTSHIAVALDAPNKNVTLTISEGAFSKSRAFFYGML